MTIDKAKAQLLKLQNQIYKNWKNWGGDMELDADDHYEALDYAIEALEKADKYRWHDLRKDPDDLPECDDMVYVYGHQCTGEIDYMMDQYVGDYGWLCSEIGEIIAWRYIEPFEEGNDG